MRTLTPDQFKKLYGQQGLDSFNIAPAQEKAPGLTDRVGTDIANRVQKVADIQNRTDTGKLEKSVQIFGQGAGMAANTLEQTAMEIPGVKQVAKGFGAGVNWLATSDISPIKHLGDVIGSNKTLQTAVQLYDTDQNFKDTVDAVANIARLGGDIDSAVNSANFTANVTNKVIKNLKETTPVLSPDAPPSGPSGIESLAQDTSAGIMNRVARLKPTDATRFEQMAGKTHGEYLKETGNFGSPDEVIAKEAQKFTNSMNEVDNALGKLPGVYKDGSLADALKELWTKAKATSSNNVKAPYLDQVRNWIKQYNEGGLTMKDINGVKRLFEKEVKLGYNKLINGEKVAQATNIDTALRKFQFKQAEKLGFKNIGELNKQTQISKFLVDKLGDQVIGQNGLNSISLTDWIMLAGGNPESVAGFLTKKFFSSKAVQAKIAQILNDGEVKGPITPDLQPTVENSLRTAFPQGRKFELPAGNMGVQSANYVPIQRTAASSMEGMAQNATRTTVNPKTGDAYIKDLKNGKTKVVPNIKQTSAIPKSLEPLAQEARKYKSAEEFVNNGVFYRGEGGKAQGSGLSTLAKGRHFALGDEPYTKTFGETKPYILKPGAKVLELGNIHADDVTSAEVMKRLGVDKPLGPIALREELIKRGYDALVYEGRYTTYGGGKNFKHVVELTDGTFIPQSKSQLTDFYNKVMGKKKKK